jgi:hypothetical protein
LLWWDSKQAELFQLIPLVNNNLTLAPMTAVMQNNPSLTITDDEDDVALAAFLAPNWGRFDQDQLVSLST